MTWGEVGVRLSCGTLDITYILHSNPGPVRIAQLLITRFASCDDGNLRACDFRDRVFDVFQVSALGVNLWSLVIS